MKSEVTTVINKPCCLIYHIRGNDDRAKELTESPPGNWILGLWNKPVQQGLYESKGVVLERSRLARKIVCKKAVKRVMHEFNISETNV